MTSFTEVVHAALADALKEGGPQAMADALPRSLRQRFREAGYEIHAIGTCVHPKLRPGEVLGREMTDEEKALLVPAILITDARARTTRTHDL